MEAPLLGTLITIITYNEVSAQKEEDISETEVPVHPRRPVRRSLSPRM